MWNFCCNYVKLRQLSQNVKIQHLLSRKNEFRAVSRKKWHALRSEPTPHFNQPWYLQRCKYLNVASSTNAAIIYNVAGTYNIAMTSVPNRKVVCQPRQRWFGVKKVPFQFFKSASPNLSQN